MQTGHAARHTTGEVGDSRAMIHHGPGETGQFRGTKGAHPNSMTMVYQTCVAHWCRFRAASRVCSVGQVRASAIAACSVVMRHRAP